MERTINQYLQNVNYETTCVEVYSDTQTVATLLSYHNRNSVSVVAIHDCIQKGATLLPMPDAIFQDLDSKIASEKQRVIVTGIDAYLTMLSEENADIFISTLYLRVDAKKQNATYLISRNNFNSALFANFKYENSMQVVYIAGDTSDITPPEIIVVPEKWVYPDRYFIDWHTLLKSLDQIPTGKHILALELLERKQAGLSNSSVIQLLDACSIAEHFYGFTADLPSNIYDTILAICKQENTPPLDLLKLRFNCDNVNTKLGVKRLLELRDDEIWQAYRWYLAKSIGRNTYLSAVIANGINADGFLRSYVCDSSIELISDKNALAYAKERADAIKEVGSIADTLIIEFISKAYNQPDNKVAPWLCCNTEAEHVEIIRRVSKYDLATGVPSIWRGLFPMLEDYFSDDFAWENAVISDYFNEYRRLRTVGTVTNDFVDNAFDFTLPPTIKMRDIILQELSTDNKTALLVADGMGAEYLPLLLAMAKRKLLNVESATIAATRMPTSTCFNTITWDSNRRLPNMYAIGNIPHDGAVKHQKCTQEQNMVASLTTFNSIANGIADGFGKGFERIVLTSDHGVSQLAILAYEMGLSKQIKWNGDADDFRYTTAPTNLKISPELESFYDASANTTYWIVRGYNHLPKKYGRFPVHGGATAEERLVPVVVFSRSKQHDIVNVPDANQEFSEVRQIIEKDYFDDI